MRNFILLAPLIFVCGCSAVQRYSEVAQPTEKTISAGVGDIILRVDLKKDLPNALGNADIFGRKTSEGIVTVQYGGISGNKIILIRNGIAFQSNETTLNRTPIYVPTSSTTSTSGHVGSAAVSLNSTTTSGTFVQPRAPQGVVSAEIPLRIEVDWKATSKIPIAGHVIIVESASPTEIRYQIEAN